MTLETAEEADSIAAAFAAPPKPRQFTRDDLQGMGADQINSLRENGQLADLLDGKS
jgi:hypothetical protein